MNINEKKSIYFYSQKGASYEMVKKNLEHLGLDKNKKIINTYPRDFLLQISENTYHEIYKDYDVLCFYEFFDFVYSEPDFFSLGFKVMEELVKEGKQIVMVGHKKIEELNFLQNEIIKEVFSLDLDYNL